MSFSDFFVFIANSVKANVEVVGGIRAGICKNTFFNSAFNGRMLKTGVTPSYRDYICEFTQAYITH